METQLQRDYQNQISDLKRKMKELEEALRIERGYRVDANVQIDNHKSGIDFLRRENNRLKESLNRSELAIADIDNAMAEWRRIAQERGVENESLKKELRART